jgi:alkanesulfonate monooxygenase SsuD/methylene tetrahydromethanopterin reductase-like flavin-dependent oxidoreductase (luciferase family)
MVKRLRYLEELGFDSVWIGDHFVNWRHARASIDPWFEAWTLLAALATKTSRIRIGMVTPITWRNPAFLARQALTVDHISNGRLELGLGAGVRGDPSHAMTGIPDLSPRERVARFREYVEIVDQLLSNEVTTYEGRYYTIKEAVMNPRPIQQPRPPIMIGASRPAMLKHAARYADTWNCGSSASTLEEQPEEIRRRNELIDKYCLDIGRDPSSLRRSFLVYNPEIARALDHNGFIGLYESEDAFRNMIDRYVDVGITEFLLFYPFNEKRLPHFEKIAKEIIPELREIYS